MVFQTFAIGILKFWKENDKIKQNEAKNMNANGEQIEAKVLYKCSVSKQYFNVPSRAASKIDFIFESDARVQKLPPNACPITS